MATSASSASSLDQTGQTTDDEKKKTSAKAFAYRQQKIAANGMGFLLQQMRSTANATVANKPSTIANLLDSSTVEEPKKPVRAIAADYKLLNASTVSNLRPELLQTVNACFNEGTTPNFNFAQQCAENNYVRSCKFSTTGSHLAVDSEDRRVRIFRLDDNEKAHIVNSILNGDLIYDLVWDPFGDNFATTSGGSPIKLWTFDGKQMSTYHGINQLDELDFAYCIAFNSVGEKLYAGYRGVVRRFQLNRPGAQISEMKTYVKGQAGQKSILSCISMSPSMQDVFAIGSFNGAVGLYSDFTDSCDMFIPTENRFVTCVQYNSTGQQIFVGGRKSSIIECYDIRNVSKLLALYERPVVNSQRIRFKLDPEDRYMFSGSTDGKLLVFDLKNSSPGESPIRPAWSVENASACAISDVDLHPLKPIVATAHGQRVFPQPLKDDSEESLMEVDDDYLFSNRLFDNSIKLWRF